MGRRIAVGGDVGLGPWGRHATAGPRHHERRAPGRGAPAAAVMRCHHGVGNTRASTSLDRAARGCRRRTPAAGERRHGRDVCQPQPCRQVASCGWTGCDPPRPARPRLHVTPCDARATSSVDGSHGRSGTSCIATVRVARAGGTGTTRETVVRGAHGGRYDDEVRRPPALEGERCTVLRVDRPWWSRCRSVSR